MVSLLNFFCCLTANITVASILKRIVFIILFSPISLLSQYDLLLLLRLWPCEHNPYFEELTFNWMAFKISELQILKCDTSLERALNWL